MASSSEISVVVPTIAGREEWAKSCISEYQRTAPGCEVVKVVDEPSCGHAWIKGFERSTKKYVHFTADDILPYEGWWQAGTQALDEGIIPAAYVVDKRGLPAMCDAPLGSLGYWPNVLVPIITRDLLELGNWLQPFHYGTDDWITYRSVKLGYEVRRIPEYKFAHHVASQGRDYTRRYADVVLLNMAMQRAGYLPPVYHTLQQKLARGSDAMRLTA